jgi:membrane protein insertase Oxa1/YidC/SpoIIIJ
MKTKFRKMFMILVTLALFGFSVYLAYTQGSMSILEQQEGLTHFAAPAQISPLVYTGIRAAMANTAVNIMNFFSGIFGGNILLSIMFLALLVELVLLYPSVRIQLKQKKIHLFHKKLVDRFNSGEITVSDTRRELDLLYAVNEKMHSRGAVFAVMQIIVFFTVLWGLNLLIKVPYLLYGSWDALNLSLLANPENYQLPMIAGLIYFMHSLVKIYYKQREDYIGRTQVIAAFLFSVIGAAAVFWFSHIFATALTLYVITLIAFSTARYIVVEQHAREWGKLAQKELLDMLRAVHPYEDKFEYISHRWNHIPVVRYINFHLLEEALSMSLGLLLALSFFGAMPS